MRQTEKEQKDSEKGKQEDKEFLRTEPLGKLLLKLALPTVAAQLINMLYNIVDRIYIGHIPGIGATAHRRGCMYASDHDRVCFCGSGRIRRRAPDLYLHGEEG